MDNISQTQKEARLFNLELAIAKFLRYGVLLAGLLIFCGWMLQIDFHHNVFEDFQVYQHVSLITHLQQMIATQSWGQLIGYAGLVVLISLPVLRVLLVAVVFLVDRDFILAACALLVLFGLGLSCALGFEI